ncbi:YdhR family protein [Desulfobulbus elongatus]|uniref:YdhR family protein n=1 Tax=Desulfobulbus elongatus TaxID=53332 RepID=UPI0004858560|nr:YdhR family protein [Desulfobulbus elongatus]
MITVLVAFKLPQPISLQQAKEIFLGTAPKYLDKPGLIRKYYFLNDGGTEAGGIYLWQSRQDAERVYTEEWKAFVRAKYGSDPSLTYLATPVVVDNLSHEIVAEK